MTSDCVYYINKKPQGFWSMWYTLSTLNYYMHRSRSEQKCKHGESPILFTWSVIGQSMQLWTMQKKKQRRAQLHVHQKWKCFVTLIWHRILSNKCYKFSFIDMETANEHNEDCDFGNGTWEEQDSQCGMH